MCKKWVESRISSGLFCYTTKPAFSFEHWEFLSLTFSARLSCASTCARKDNPWTAAELCDLQVLTYPQNLKPSSAAKTHWGTDRKHMLITFMLTSIQPSNETVSKWEESQVQKIFKAGLSLLIAPINLQLLETMKSPSLLKILDRVSTTNTTLIIINCINFLFNFCSVFPNRKQAKNT